MHLETSTIHTGVNIDSTFQSVTTPIYTSSIFYSKQLGEKLAFDYTRSGNPTRHALETNLANLENGVAASATCTGMSAITACLSILKSGDHLIAPTELYGGTHRLLKNYSNKFGIEVQFLDDLNDLEALKAAIKENTRMVWIETPSNPLLHITDITAVVQAAKQASPNILLVADNTFMSPVFQRPLDLGCDIVVHSTTKYINGHSDVVGGVVISKTVEVGREIAYQVNCLGLSASPFDAWLVLRGVKTLPLRMKKHEENAKKIANYLSKNELVKKVFYPGLPSHPQYKLAATQMTGFGGIVSFELDPEKTELNKFFENLKLFSLAVSLGGVESLIEQPWSMSHASMSEEARMQAGITPQIVRISAGIENADDLTADLELALESCCCCCC